MAIAHDALADRRVNLFADEVQRDPPRMGCPPMLPKINSLPGSESEPAGFEWQTEVHRRERGTDVRGHVIRALTGVLEK